MGSWKDIYRLAKGWVNWEGGHRHPFPTQTTTGLASLADFFLLFPPNAERDPRLQKMEKQNNKETEKKCPINSVQKQDYNVCAELYSRPFCIYLVACSFLTATQIFCLNDETQLVVLIIRAHLKNNIVQNHTFRKFTNSKETRNVPCFRLPDSGEDAKEKGTRKVGGAGKRKKEGRESL